MRHSACLSKSRLLQGCVTTLLRRMQDGFAEAHQRPRPPGCGMPSFARFLAQPWILGLQDMLFECIDHSLGGPVGPRTHDWYHIEPQAQCLFDASEKIAVDFILRCCNTVPFLCVSFQRLLFH